IETAIIAESARWGDGIDDGTTRTKDDYWTPEVNRLDGLMDGNAVRFINALRAEGFYPGIDPVVFNEESGSFAPGFTLTMTNPNGSGTIYYTTDGSDPMLSNGNVSPSAITYSSPVSIPANEVLVVQSRVKQGSEWSARHTGSYTVVSLFINEFLASNSTGITDESGTYEDWIELYNGGSLPVDIGGMYITDDLTNLTLWQIPATNPALTTIPAGGHLLLWADKNTADGVLHVDIKLSASGEQIGISVMGNSGLLVLDSLTFGEQFADTSTGRFPDGSSFFRTFPSPTPGAANELPFSSLYINEFLASNSTGITDESGAFEDWIEIYNDGDDPVDIGGMYITDDLTNPAMWQIPATDPNLTTIPAKGFLILWADKNTAEGVLHVDIKLGASGEQIGLAQVIGVDTGFVDSLTFGAQITDVSEGRDPDGSSTFRKFYVPTPGAPNIISFISGIYINEVLPANTTSGTDNNGENDPWIEIYN
ncbi:MAG: lamin tail domain-containing protein, partial [Bacteroidetes bacterium]|nr:lamin tail domain-containing protein [Bacteroidota bacterium]